MKKLSLLPLAVLALAVACSEASRTPTELTEAPNAAPQKPRFDDIPNALDNSIDATAEVMALNVGGANGTTTLYVSPTNGDGKSGCNLTGSTTLSITISSSDAAVATVSPATATFTSCGDVKTLTITPVGAGSATISVTQNSNDTGATFNLAPATFTVNVAPATVTNTAPSISVAGVSAGASYDKGSVPAATCQVTDAEDGNSTFAATLSAITGPYAADGIGSQEASCSYTDGGGLTTAASATYSIVDPSAPTITHLLTPASADGDNGWYRSDVTLTWTVAEAESPTSLIKTGCVDQSITADQAETTYSCSASSAGGSPARVDVKIKRDGTAPTVDYTSASPAANAAGWYKEDVVATFTATDNLSGFGASASLTTTGTGTTTGEGTAITVGSPAFTDEAGNTVAAGSATSAAFKIDKAAPTNIQFVGGPADGGAYYWGFVPAEPTCTAEDALSGVKSCTISGYSGDIGSHTMTASATDIADNTSTSLDRSYSVSAWTLNGFFAPVNMAANAVNTVKAGSTVPLKFEVFAGPTELTTTSVVKLFQVYPYACESSQLEDPVDITTTGGTSLRYDSTTGQFVQNWQTPKTAGKCFKAVVTTQDGSSIEAFLKLK